MQPATLHVAPPPPPPSGLLWPKLKIAPLLIPLWIFQLLRACRPAPCPNLLETWKKLWSRRRRRSRRIRRRRRRRRRRKVGLFIINPSPRSKKGRAPLTGFWTQVEIFRIRFRQTTQGAFVIQMKWKMAWEVVFDTYLTCYWFFQVSWGTCLGYMRWSLNWALDHLTES